MEPRKKFYDTISILFTIWSIPSVLLLVLIFSNGPITLLASTGVLLIILVIMSPLLTSTLTISEYPPEVQDILLWMADIAPNISISPRTGLLLFLIIFIGPIIIFWRTIKMQNKELTIDEHNWNTLSISNIKETIYQTAHFQPKPSTTAIKVENRFVKLSFTSKENLEQWLKELESTTDEHTCGLCNPNEYHHTKNEEDIQSICDDCLRKTIEQLPDEDIQITDAILATRI